MEQVEASSPGGTKTHSRIDVGRIQGKVSGPTTSDGTERSEDLGEAEVMTRLDDTKGSSGLDGAAEMSTRGGTKVPEA